MLYLVANLLLLLASIALQYRLFPQHNRAGSLTLLGGLLLYLSQITLIILVLGVLLRRLDMLNLSLAILAWGLLLTGLLRRQWSAALRHVLRRAGQAWSTLDAWGSAASALILITAALLALKVYLLPPSSWDVFMYHMAPAAEWLQQGRIPLRLDVPMNGMNVQALGMTILNYWVFHFTGSDLLVGLPQALFGLILALTAYALVRHATADASLAVKTAALVLTIPFVVMQATTAKDHIALNAALFSGCLFLWWTLSRPEPRALIPAGAAFGLMLGFKMGAVIHLLVALAVFGLLLWRARREAGLRFKERGVLFGSGAIACALIIALGSFWYLRGIIASGDFTAPYLARSAPAGIQGAAPPANPYLLKASLNTRAEEDAGSEDNPVWDRLRRIASVVSAEKLAGHAANLLPSIYDHRGPYDPDLIWISGFGPQFALLGVPVVFFVILQMLKGRVLRDPMNLPVLTALVLLPAYALVYPVNPNSYRLFSFLAFMLIPHAAYLMHRHGVLQTRLPSALFNLLAAFCVIWGLGNSILPLRDANPSLLREFVSLPDQERTSGRYTAYFSEHRPNMHWLLQSVPAEEPIAVIHGGKRFGGIIDFKLYQIWSYPLYDPAWKREVHYLKQHLYLDCPDAKACRAKPALNARLKADGISLISTCRNVGCYKLDSPGYLELAPGLYYLQDTPGPSSGDLGRSSPRIDRHTRAHHGGAAKWQRR